MLSIGNRKCVLNAMFIFTFRARLTETPISGYTIGLDSMERRALGEIPIRAEPDPLAMATYVAKARTGIEAAGVTVDFSTDFAELQQVSATARPSAGPSEQFSTLFFDITPEDGFWLKGTDASGKVVHLQALRRDHLAGLSLAQHWKQQLRRLHVDQNPGSHLAGHGAPIASRITGNVVYHGDMWIDPVIRGRDFPAALSRLALVLALWKWSPDYVYGFLSESLALEGFHVKEGYMHHQPEGVAWGVTPPGINADDWIAWLTHEDLVLLTRFEPPRPQPPRDQTQSGN